MVITLKQGATKKSISSLVKKWGHKEQPKALMPMPTAEKSNCKKIR